jgi:hypothetical protein
MDKSRLQPSVRMDGHETAVPVPCDAANGATGNAAVAPSRAATEGDGLFSGPTREVPLVALAWARSGDKGDISNIGVIARRAEWLPLLRAQLTPERVSHWLAHLVHGPVSRYELPGIGAMNFVCEQALDGGGMSSLRNDPLGKGMAQILLTMPVQVPAAWALPAPSLQ